MPHDDDASPPRFPLALRGYDRHAVDAFLETDVGEVAPQAKRQLDRFSERVEVILTAAEETAAELRAEAEAESRRTILAASAKADEILVDGDRRAQRLISEGNRRRREIEEEISTLLARRDELTGQLRGLAHDLQVSAEQNSRIQAIDEEDEELPADEEDEEEGEPGADELEEVDDLDDLDLDELDDDDGVEEDEYGDDEFATANGVEGEIDPALGVTIQGPRFRPRDQAPIDPE